MTSVLIRRREDAHRHREESHVKTRTEIGVMLPHTKGCVGAPKSEAARKNLPQELSASVTLLTP